ncbi:MAG: hypothetical protein NC906_01705 [Candidatus Omnitrophica bacterium]|nr:hypothetical protein [Candidatus Omnitrophota bacterium]
MVIAVVRNEPSLEDVVQLSKRRKTDIISVSGEVMHTVVIAEPSEFTTARKLVEYLNNVTSGNVRVVVDSEGMYVPEEFRIHVGKTSYVKNLNLDFESLHPFGYYIKLVDKHNLVIAGKRSHNNYAIYDFLKKFCGYR